MGKLKNILLMVAGFALAAFGQEDSVKVEDIAFSKAYLAIEGGEVYPFGDLNDATYNTLWGRSCCRISRSNNRLFVGCCRLAGIVTAGTQEEKCRCREC